MFTTFSYDFVEMTAASSEIFTLAQRDVNLPQLTAFVIKLTDSSLQSLQDSVRTCNGYAGSSSKSGSIEFQPDDCRISFGPDAQAFKFTLSKVQDASSKGPQDAIEQCRDGGEWIKLGAVRHRIKVLATDDSYHNIKKKALRAEEEAKKSALKVLKQPKEGVSKASEKIWNKVQDAMNASSKKGSVTSASSSFQSSGSSQLVSPPRSNGHQRHQLSSSTSSSLPTKSRFDITKKSVRERIIHHLIIRPSTASGMLNRLLKEGLSDVDRQQFEATFNSVAQVRGGKSQSSTAGSGCVYDLQPQCFSEVSCDWPFYTNYERQLVRRELNNGAQSSRGRNAYVIDDIIPKKESSRRSVISDVSSSARIPPKEQSFSAGKKTTNGYPELTTHHRQANPHSASTTLQSRKRPADVDSQMPKPKKPPPIEQHVAVTSNGYGHCSSEMGVSNHDSNGSPPSNCSFWKDFPSIDSDEQRRRYKQAFDNDYPEYISCYEQLNQFYEEIAIMVNQLKQYDKNSDEYSQLERDICSKYHRWEEDKTIDEVRNRHYQLRLKLAVLKARVQDYDDRKAIPMASRPPRLPLPGSSRGVTPRLPNSMPTRARPLPNLAKAGQRQTPNVAQSLGSSSSAAAAASRTKTLTRANNNNNASPKAALPDNPRGSARGGNRFRGNMKSRLMTSEGIFSEGFTNELEIKSASDVDHYGEVVVEESFKKEIPDETDEEALEKLFYKENSEKLPTNFVTLLSSPVFVQLPCAIANVAQRMLDCVPLKEGNANSVENDLEKGRETHVLEKFPEGHLGKLQLHKSGKVTLKLNSAHSLPLLMPVQINSDNFVEKLVCLHLNDNEPNGGTMDWLGTVKSRWIFRIQPEFFLHTESVKPLLLSFMQVAMKVVDFSRMNISKKLLYGITGNARHVELRKSGCVYGLNFSPARFNNRNVMSKFTAYQSVFVKGLFTGSSQRYAHTDVTFPDFDEYRRDSTKDIKLRNEDTDVPRKMFSYLSLGVGTAATLYCTKTVALQVISYKGPPFSEEAGAVAEINLNLVPEGKNSTFLWRGKPVFVRHRTAKEINVESQVDISKLRDPEHDHQRVQKPEWLIVLAPCTHLGCVPIPYAGDYKGYFCPCHGSHYDASGRIRRGPAPRNLEVPHYVFKDENTVLIGKTHLTNTAVSNDLCKQEGGSISIFGEGADFVVTAVLAVFWFIASCAWASGVNVIKGLTDFSLIKNMFVNSVNPCKDKESCHFTPHWNYAALNVSLIAGFACFFLFASNLWFIWKETEWFKSRQTPNVASGQTAGGYPAAADVLPR
ncbi:Cytochrome b-c1 complex subunit Rieske, mitochondrial [Trichinella spiralis]|uniref:Cytochrome b-c1 complex subunit Rieske, mitochondrial n=1 Tax=Trichinella spiralis TaxID=6334 RepID=A0A0V1C321_TRISP|nr:Cytochrome b-c1 complex subunit Rieske, mitochondrial [Trichinella spiralis]